MRFSGRTPTTTTWLNEYLRDWPGVRQVFRLERTRTLNGKLGTEVVYGGPPSCIGTKPTPIDCSN